MALPAWRQKLHSVCARARDSHARARAHAPLPTTHMGLCQGSSIVPVFCCCGLESLTPRLEQNMPWPAQPLLSIATHSYPFKLPNRALLQASSLLAGFPCFLVESPLPRLEKHSNCLLRHPNIPLGVGTAYSPQTNFPTWPCSRPAAFWLFSLVFDWRVLDPGFTTYFLLDVPNPL